MAEMAEVKIVWRKDPSSASGNIELRCRAYSGDYDATRLAPDVDGQLVDDKYRRRTVIATFDMTAPAKTPETELFSSMRAQAGKHTNLPFIPEQTDVQ